MWTGAKSCCSPDGHCKRKTPAPQSSKRECKQIAFDHQKSVDFQIDLPIVAAAEIDLPCGPVELLERGHGTNLVEPSPPDLQILNSIFLI
jgi:hypothetical protein